MPQTDFNLKLIDEFRANKGKVGGMFAGRPVLLLTTTGAKSGQTRTTPLVYTHDGDQLVVIASMGGAPTSPNWYHNLKAKPQVTVELGEEKFTANATIPQGAERDRLFAQHASGKPMFNEYQQKTTRRIPAVVLKR